MGHTSENTRLKAISVLFPMIFITAIVIWFPVIVDLFLLLIPLIYDPRMLLPIDPV